MKESPCLRSGFCCKQGPCPYGELSADGGYCVHLSVASVTPSGNEIHECRIASWIMAQPGADITPAFGTGCCSPLFNPARDSIRMEFKS